MTTNPQTSSSYDVLPLELVMEILGRLPVKSIARFLLVSKLWATTIRSRDFIKSFPLGSCSSHEPRFLIAFSGGLDTEEHWHFFSSSFISRLSCPIPNSLQRSHYVKGLLCIGCGREQFIVNPTTGKSIALPRVRIKRKVAISYFGYDSVSDQYKVLCMTKAYNGGNSLEQSSQHQVFTLGDKKRSWRMVECNIPHRPCSSGVCIDGAIYYMAETGSIIDVSQRSLMSFDSRSEKFDLVTGLSPEILQNENKYSHLVISNLEGKVAITTQTSRYTFDVWVLMDQNAEEENKWLRKLTFSVEPWETLFNSPSVFIKGITQTGEFILAPYHYYNSDDVYVALYNHYTDTLEKVKVQRSAEYSLRNHAQGIFFSDYVESVRFL
ncbi:putative F-box protein [Raphanus sativus]|nr:putative F-box protein [Raphanus sativus]